MCTLYWHEQFEELERLGLWGGHVAERWALVAVYMPLINADLKRVAEDHHKHRIRYQHRRIRPGGQPEDMYNFPEAFNGRQCGMQVSQSNVDELVRILEIPENNIPNPLPAEVSTMFQRWCHRNKVEITRENAKTIYCQVRALFIDICQNG